MRQLPDEFIRSMRPLLGDAMPAFLHAMEEEPPYRGLRVNTTRVQPAAFAAIAPWPMLPSPLCPEGFRIEADCPAGKDPLHAAGAYYLQEPAAQMAALAMPVTPGMRVLDLCAAPGGKSTHMAARLAEAGGFLAANECVADRARILASNLERLGFVNTCVLSAMPDVLAAAAPEVFDGVLADAPCSGEGMFRREPRAIPEWKPAHVQSCARRQSLILDAAAALTAPGGTLVYSTCTLNPTENEGVCAGFLQRHPGWRMEPIPGMEALPHGNPAWIEGFPAEITAQTACAVRLMPHLTPGEGHFIARFRKSDGVHDPVPTPERRLPDSGLQMPAKEETAAFAALMEALCGESCPGALRKRGDALWLVHPEALTLPALVQPGVQAAQLCRPHAENGGFSRRKPAKTPLRLEPTHSLAMAWGNRFRQQVCVDRETALRWLRGEAIPAEGSGWGAVLLETPAGRFPLGLCKCSGGLAKNHLPKGLRI